LGQIVRGFGNQDNHGAALGLLGKPPHESIFARISLANVSEICSQRAQPIKICYRAVEIYSNQQMFVVPSSQTDAKVTFLGHLRGRCQPTAITSSVLETEVVNHPFREEKCPAPDSLSIEPARQLMRKFANIIGDLNCSQPAPKDKDWIGVSQSRPLRGKTQNPEF